MTKTPCLTRDRNTIRTDNLLNEIPPLSYSQLSFQPIEGVVKEIEKSWKYNFYCRFLRLSMEYL